MNNIIDYYYNLHPSQLIYKDGKYSFEYLNKNYTFEKVARPISDIEALYNVNKKMLERNILVHKIIPNIQNNIVTFVDGYSYILMEVFINKDARINLSDLCYINNNSILIECSEVLNRYDWATLWEAKNDFFETQINEVGKKYPNLCTYANYYIGLAENAICYTKKASLIKEDALLSICSKRINSKDNLYSLYNPLNYIYDYRIRDISEYIKSSFFNDEDAMLFIKEYFDNNYLSYKETLLFFARLLYPSYFFDLYDEIINNDLDEKEINRIINKSSEYEKFLNDVYFYLSSTYKRYIPSVDWLIKRSFF